MTQFLKFKLYYYSWFWIGRFIAPRRVNDATIEGFFDHFIFNLKWAKPFGIDVVFLGDSNCEFAKDRKTSSKWKPLIVVNIGKAGTRIDHWNTFFKTPKGKELLAFILENSKIILSNIGGNHVVQNQMENMNPYLAIYVKTFESKPHVMINIPPIHAGIFPDVKTTKANVIKANKIIGNYFPGKNRYLVNVYDPLLDPKTQEAWIGVLGDPIHFNDWSDQVYRIPLVRETIKFILKGL